MPAEGSDPSIPSEVRDLVDFFDKYLHDVQFPDVDRSRLAELASRVKQCSDELVRVTEQARTARDSLDRAQVELRRAAERGLAYARVYVEGDHELSEALAEVTLGEERAEKKPKQRQRSPGRGKKSKAGAVRGDDQAPEKPTLPFTSPELTEAA